MSRENIIVDMQSPTPFDSYRFKREKSYRDIYS